MKLKNKNLFLYLLTFLMLLVVSSYLFINKNSKEVKIENKILNNNIAKNEVIVLKSKYCSCCNKYVDYLKNKGYKVNVQVMSDLELEKKKDDLNIPKSLRSCHTSIFGNKIVEGHVPLEMIEKFIVQKDNKKIVGISIPGMPIGVPGMEGPRFDKIEVYSFDNKGKISKFGEV